MPDRVSVTSTQSWGSRLSESIKSVLFGVLFFVVAFPLLFWNEGRAVRTAKSLEEGAGAVVSVAADNVDASNEGKLVHVSGTASTEEILEDDAFGVSVNAVKLVRSVEMYQWVERESSTTEKKLGGSEETTTTYEYAKEWSESLVDSSRFESPAGHENPGAFPYDGRTETARLVTLGAYELSDAQISMLDKSEPLRLTELPSTLGEKVQLQEGSVFVGENPASPQVGDARVRFRVVRPGAVSVVARQVGKTFEPYRAKAGGTVFLLEESMASADAMFEGARTANTVMTWIVRGIGFFMMFLGLGVVFRPLSVAGDVVPLVGNLLGAGAGLVAFFLAAFFSCATIAFAWIFYRPLLGIALLVVAVVSVILLVRMSKGRARTTGPPPLPPKPAA